MSDEAEAAEEAPAKPTAMLVREQQLGYGLAAVAAVAGGIIGGLDGNVLLSGLGLVGAAILALAVRRAQRIFTAIAAVVAGIAVPFLPVEVLFLLYSFLLMSRASRAQGKINATRPRRSPQQRREARAARTVKSTAGVRDGSKPRSPTANRRYTPPKAKPGGRR